MRASLYFRLSKASREESTGRHTQETDLRALAASHGLAVVACHSDDGESGALRNRPGFLAWLADARSGRADHLLAYRLDRVSRGGAAGLAAFLDVLAGLDRDGRQISAPVRFLSHADGLDSSSAAWEIQAAVLGALAKSELELIRSRIRRSKELARSQGRWLGGTVPAGFRVVDNPDGPGRIVEPDPALVGHLREASRQLLDDGLGAATRYLQSSPLQPPRADHWHRSTVACALTSDAACERLWSPAEARAIQEALSPATPSPGRSRPRLTRLLTGVAACDACGSRMVAQAGRDRGRLPRYQCPSWSTGHPCPAPTTVTAPPLEAAVEAAFLEGWGALPETRVEHAFDARADRLAVLQGALAEHWQALPHLRGPARALALAELEAVEAEVARVEAEPVPSATVLRATGRTLAEAWHAADMYGRNLLLRRAGAAIRVRKARTPGARSLDLDRVDGLEALRHPV